jgi:Sec-independent protein translocase protein TatA
MGFHIFDLIVIAVIGLAIFGPKALQSMARSTGKGLGQAKEMKDKLMSELPLEEISKVSQKIPRVPLNTQEALHMLLTPEKETKNE